MIVRTFREIPDKRHDRDEWETLVNLGWSQGFVWSDLLQSKRILLVSEAGFGKTYECRDQARRLWAAGEPAFFVEMSELAYDDLQDLLNSPEVDRLDAWRAAQSDMATFFLDSIDELKLTRRSFERALKRVRKCIGSQLHRVRIVLTARPIPFDRQAVRDILPVPAAPSLKSNEEAFAEIAMISSRDRGQNGSGDPPPDWREVEMMPLSDEQIIEFSRGQGVHEPERLLEDLQGRNAEAFARRPQDLIELCADWCQHQRIRTHREQVATNIRVKLCPRQDRPEPAELSADRALDGARRLALAVQVTRRSTIRHSAEAGEEEAALDPAIILSDWDPDKRKALLERPLFGFASYGRVRFHHRSVAESLAAERLSTLRGRGMSIRALKRLLFAETRGKTIVRPSMRPVAGWLALQETEIFALLRDTDPAVLLTEGDPGSLPPAQRVQALRAFVDRCGPGGWRGLQVPNIQIHRFASGDLANEIQEIWQQGVENPAVRKVLINLIEAARIDACADIACAAVQNTTAPVTERRAALNALVALADRRLGDLAASLANGDTLGSDKVAQAAILCLFPGHMSVGQLCRALRWTPQESARGGDLVWQLPTQITESNLDRPALEELRDGLVALVSEDLDWFHDEQKITSSRRHLGRALAAICERGLDMCQNDTWLHAGVLALRMHAPDYGAIGPIGLLRKRLAHLDADAAARLFWAEDALLQSVRKADSPWDRLARIMFFDGVAQLMPARDLGWVRSALGDPIRDAEERAMLLEAALRLVPNECTAQEHCEGLKSLVTDRTEFVDKIDDWLMNSAGNEERQRHWESKQAKRTREEACQKAKARDSWIAFWREVAEHPDDAFSSERGPDTAWKLWHAMRQDGDESRSAGWNRRFMEERFGQETADRLRSTLMPVWRNNCPSLPSERPDDTRNTFSVNWQLGLAGIYAEAEDPNWAHTLTGPDAERAARYALVELNCLPQWMEALTDAHPDAVGQTLGDELSWELNQPPPGHSYLLQGIAHASEGIAQVFLPRLESWLRAGGDIVNNAEEVTHMAPRVRQVTDVLLRHGDACVRARLLNTALRRLEQRTPATPFLVWLSAVLRMDPATGIAMLEDRAAAVKPAARSEVVAWMASLFWNHGDMIAIDLRNARFTPPLLLRLARLAYRHVQVEDDAQHEGSFSPDERDDVERVRSHIVTALLDAEGKEGLDAKLELAADPLCAHFKDRIRAMAEERWAQEIDADAFDEKQARELDRSGEAPASTKEAMFAILQDRLSGLDELLLRDDSPREAWAGIECERVMRREIARELWHAANGIYTVDQEAVTGVEKETDIRLRSTAPPLEAVIEIKLGNKWSGRELRNAIKDQLVTKYMAAENCKTGALVVPLAKDQKWGHPDERRRICADNLLALLREEAERVQADAAHDILIDVHLLDVRPLR